MSEFIGDGWQEPYEDEIEDTTEEELSDEILEKLAEGQTVRLIMGGDTQFETIQEFIATMRRAGAEVIVPNEN